MAIITDEFHFKISLNRSLLHPWTKVMVTDAVMRENSINQLQICQGYFYIPVNNTHIFSGESDKFKVIKRYVERK